MNPTNPFVQGIDGETWICKFSEGLILWVWYWWCPSNYRCLGNVQKVYTLGTAVRTD
jgi:hypothetical protein